MSWGFGVCLSERSEFHTPPAHPSIAGNPKGKHAGAFSFGYFFFEQAKKSNSPMKGEKLISIQEIKKKEKFRKGKIISRAPAQKKQTLWFLYQQQSAARQMIMQAEMITINYHPQIAKTCQSPGQYCRKKSHCYLFYAQFPTLHIYQGNFPGLHTRCLSAF